MDRFSFFTLNIFVNSFLAFFTTALLIEAVIFIFRIKQGRCASYLRILPILKLVVDPFLYNFPSWSYLQGINSIECKEGSRMLMASFVYPHEWDGWSIFSLYSGIQMRIDRAITDTSVDLTFTLADLIGYHLSAGILNIFAITFALITFIFIIRKGIHLFLSTNEINSLESLIGVSGKKVKNRKLADYLQRNLLHIIISPSLSGSPFVAGFIPNAIFVPKNLSKELSQKEYEAVIAHEVTHIHYKDNAVRIILEMIHALFWWVPTKWLIQRIEEGQEIGCDSNCKKFGVKAVDLSAAIYKSAKQQKSILPHVLVQNFTKTCSLQKRLNLLLNFEHERFRVLRIILTASAVCVAFLGVFLGRYWIF